MTPIDIESLSDAAFQAIKPVILDRLTDQDIEDECDARGIGGADDDLDDLPGTDVDVIYHGDLALASEYWSRGGYEEALIHLARALGGGSWSNLADVLTVRTDRRIA